MEGNRENLLDYLAHAVLWQINTKSSYKWKTYRTNQKKNKSLSLKDCCEAVVVPLDWEGIKNQVYECVWCHTTFKGEECLMLDRLACPNCGCRVLKKVRPPIARRVKAT